MAHAALAQLRGIAVAAFRLVRDLTQGGLGDLLGVDGKTISRWEAGQGTTQERLEAVARKLDYPPVQVARTLHLLEALHEGAAPRRDPFAPDPEQELSIYELSREIARTSETWLREDFRRARIEQDRAEARALWEQLTLCGPPHLRPAVIRTLPEYQTWAMVELLCEKSIDEAANDASAAGELADLAVTVADLVDVGSCIAWKNLLLAYAWAHVGNAMRVACELPAADLIFAWVNELWSPADAIAIGVLDPGRVPALEASLRRDQRRFPDALELLDKAVSLSPDPGKVLLAKAFTLEQMGNYAAAVEQLRRADALLVERTERDDFALRFNLGVNLCHLSRFPEAAQLVPLVLDQAEALDNDLDSVRAMWLQGRVAAGLGHSLAAVGAFKLVATKFGRRRMDYDVALVSLELGGLLLELGRYAEVKALSRTLTPVFERNGVHREALKALSLFRDAVERETATANLARRIVAFLYLARGNEAHRFEATAL